MFVGVLIGFLSATGSPQMVQCVDVPPGRTAASIEARGKAWFVRDTPLPFGGHRYAKAGPVLGLAPDQVVSLGTHGGATVFARAGDGAHDMLYIVADVRDCTFQPYRRISP